MIIIVRKGSTFFGRIIITDKSYNRILLTETDKLIFTVKTDLNDDNKNYIIKKIINSDRELNGEYCFELTPEETDLPAGTYFYDIGIQRKNGEFYHIDMPDEFIVKQSISRKEELNELL